MPPRLATLALLLCPAASLHAQAPVERREPITTLKVETRLITVPVNALDADGAPIGSLTAADFHLFEDGKEQRIAFFDRDSATPLSIVLAIDTSDSTLRNARLEKDAAKRFVHAVLRPPASTPAASDDLDVVEFSDAVRELVPFTTDQRRIADGLNQIARGEATALYDAVYLASQRLGETSLGNNRRRVLVLITDGGDTAHGVGYDQALEAAQRAGVIIYSLVVIPIYADAGRNTGGEHALIELSHETGGKYFYIEDTRDLSAAFDKVTSDLRTQYVLSYQAPPRTPRSRPDGLRTLRVELGAPAPGTTLRYRSGYYAPRPGDASAVPSKP